jgi:hypothetical protein
MLAVMELSSSAQKDFFRFRDRARKLNRKDGEPHDFTLAAFGPSGWGITYVTGTIVQLSALKIADYIQWKRHEVRAPYWVLITETSGKAPQFIRIVIAGAPSSSV